MEGRRTEREFTVPGPKRLSASMGVPTAAADEETRRVSVGVLLTSTIIPSFKGLRNVPEVTVRMEIAIDPEDSNGIPTAVEAEVSSELSREETNQVFSLSDAEKVALLMRIYDQAFEDGHLRMLETPILTPFGVRWLVLRWDDFRLWLGAHWIDDFDALIDATWAFRQRAAARLFVQTLHDKIIPEMEMLEFVSRAPYRLLCF